MARRWAETIEGAYHAMSSQKACTDPNPQISPLASVFFPLPHRFINTLHPPNCIHLSKRRLVLTLTIVISYLLPLPIGRYYAVDHVTEATEGCGSPSDQSQRSSFSTASS